MPITEVTITTRIPDDGAAEDTERNVRKLYTLAELKDGKHIEDEPDDIIPSRVGSAYQTALDKIGIENSEVWEPDGDWLEYIHEKAGITYKFADATWDVSYHQGSMWFSLPEKTDIDVPVFLRAMKDYYAGIDYRRDGISPESYITAPAYRQHKIDLRSKDARIVKEQGLVVHVVSRYTVEGALDLDYHYDDVSEAFKVDCEEFLNALNHEVARLLRADQDDDGSEDRILDQANDNEWLFDKEGRRA